MAYPTGTPDMRILADHDVEPCDHEDYDVNVWTGRAHCHCCGEKWYASEEEVVDIIHAQSAFARFKEREHRKEWRQVINRFGSLISVKAVEL